MPAHTEEEKAALTQTRGRQAAKIKDPEEKKAYIAGSADVDKDFDATAQSTAIQENKQKSQEVLGSMKKGGPIEKTGIYKLHKGEHVIPKESSMASSKGKIPKHGIKHTHTEHHTDGTHTVTHSHHDGTSTSHALPDVAALNDHMTGALSPEPQTEGGMQAAPDAAAAGAAGPMV